MKNLTWAPIILIANLLQKVSFATLPAIDSLRNLLQTNLPDSAHFITLLELGKAYHTLKNDSSIVFYTQALNFSQEKKLSRFEANVLFRIAIWHIEQGNDSLAKIYFNKAEEIMHPDLIKDYANQYLEIGQILRKKGDNTKALEYLFRASEKFKEINLKNEQAITYNQIGLTLRSLGNYNQAIDFLSKSLELKKEISDKNGMAIAYGNLGVVHRAFGKDDKAIENYILAIEIFQELGNKEGISKAYNNIASIYFNSESFDQALKYYTLSLAISEELRDKVDIARTCNNIGRIHQIFKDYDKAMAYYNRAENLCIKVGEKEILAYVYQNKGNIFLTQGKTSLAIKELEKSLKIREQIKDLKGLISTYTALSNVYSTLAGKSPVEQRNENLWKAISYAEKAYTMALHQNLPLQQNNASRQLMELYELMGNPSKALKYAKIYIQLQESLTSEEKNKVIAELQAKFDISQKEQEIEKQKLIIEKQEAENQKRTAERNYMSMVLILLLIISVGSLWGLAEIRRKNQSLVATQNKLTELIKTKDRIFSIIAHDLKSPFTSLVGLTQIMAMKSDRLESEKVSKFSKSIYQLSRQLLELIENLLHWSRSQTGRLKMEPKNIQVETLISDIVSLVSVQAEEKNLSINTIIAPEVSIYADYDSVATVIRNLMSNSIKFTSQGGTITISAYREDQKVAIKICDTGIGIAPENLNRLFKPDEVFSTKGTNQESGTGLGLIVCKEFIQANGGTISVESILGEGSCFTLFLPASASIV